MTRLPRPIKGAADPPLGKEEGIRRARKVLTPGSRGDDLHPEDVNLSAEEEALRSRVKPSLFARLLRGLIERISRSRTNA